MYFPKIRVFLEKKRKKLNTLQSIVITKHHWIKTSSVLSTIPGVVKLQSGVGSSQAGILMHPYM